MNKLVLLAATLVFSTGIMVAQSSPTASDTGKPNAAPEQPQRGAQATPPLVPHQPPEMNANPERPGATPETRLPSTTVDDQQPGNSSSPTSTMGTTGNTPGSDQSTTGNQSGNLPSETTTAPKADNPQKPKSDTEPHDRYWSGSSNPNSSANGAGSNDMSGSSPRMGNGSSSGDQQSTPPHIARTHTPDAGTEMNPASLELASETVKHY